MSDAGFGIQKLAGIWISGSSRDLPKIKPAKFGMQQMAGVWVAGFSIAFDVNPPGSGTGGSHNDIGDYGGSEYTKTTTPRQRALEEQRKKALSESLLLAFQDEDDLILLLLGDF